VLLLFEEPASGLELRSMEAVAPSLRSLKAHSAILAISYDYAFIRRAADHVLCLRENELQADFYLNEQSLPQLNAIFQRMKQDALEAAECSSPPAETTLKKSIIRSIYMKRALTTKNIILIALLTALYIILTDVIASRKEKPSLAKLAAASVSIHLGKALGGILSAILFTQQFYDK